MSDTRASCLVLGGCRRLTSPHYTGISRTTRRIQLSTPGPSLSANPTEALSEQHSNDTEEEEVVEMMIGPSDGLGQQQFSFSEGSRKRPPPTSSTGTCHYFRNPPQSDLFTSASDNENKSLAPRESNHLGSQLQEREDHASEKGSHGETDFVGAVG